MIEMYDLHAGYGRKRAVLRGLGGAIAEGHIYGLLGANGSGKTTLMKTWAGALYPVSGRVDVFGSIPADRKAEFLASTVYMPDEMSFPPLAVAAFERIYGRFRPHFSHEEFNGYLHALDFSFGVRLDRLSTGNRKKFFIAFALACNPALLLMDEPTNGLDIESKKAFRRILASFDTTGRVVVVSTHQVADLNNLLSAVVVLREGRMVLNATFDAIAGKLSFGGPSAPDAFYADGLRSISLNRDGEYTDVDVESLYHAIHESERVRSFIAENFSGNSSENNSVKIAEDCAGKEGVC